MPSRHPMMNTTIRFTRNHGPYMKDQTANFPPDIATLIIQNGAAELLPEPTRDTTVKHGPLPERTRQKNTTTKAKGA